MTLVRVNETASGSDFLIVNLQMVTRVEGRSFNDEQEEHQARVFFCDGGSMNLVGADADRVSLHWKTSQVTLVSRLPALLIQRSGA